LFCPRCGTESPQDYKFCKSCGNALGTADPAQNAATAPTPVAQAFPPPQPAPYAAAPIAYVPPPASSQYPPPAYAQYPQVAPPRAKGSAGRNIIVLLVVLVGVGFAALRYFQSSKKVIIGTQDEVFYSGSATKDQASALGNALKGDGYFQDKGVTVLLDKESSGTTISFVVKDGFWNQPGALSSFEEIARTVAPTVGGLPVVVNLVNSTKDVEKSSTVGEATLDGGDGVFYEGTATLAQAQAVGQQLKTDGFFEGKGANVFLVKHDNATTVMFVVGEDAWDNPQMVTDFEVLLRSIAPGAGGLPIDLQLVTSDLTVKKDEVISQ
jgi:hypothetical protein